MTRQERIDHMLSELGEGWEPRLHGPTVRNGPVMVRHHAGTGLYEAWMNEGTVGSLEAAEEPRAAVDALLAAAHRQHEEHAKILKAAEAARGWAGEYDSDEQPACTCGTTEKEGEP